MREPEATPGMGQNPGDPEVEEPDFYPVVTNWAQVSGAPHVFGPKLGIGVDRLKTIVAEVGGPGPYYRELLSDEGQLRVRPGSLHYKAAVIESLWYDSFQPEYKAWPAIVAGLASTSIEIDCRHVLMPFPCIAIRLPEGFVQEPGGPVIRGIFATMFANTGLAESAPVASTRSGPVGPSRIPIAWYSPGTTERSRSAIFSILLKFSDRDGDDAWSTFSLDLVDGQTVAERFESSWFVQRPKLEGPVSYYPSRQLAKEMLSLAIGITFFATGRRRVEAPIIADDHRPRSERRRFEKENDGHGQPTFHVGRELSLPRVRKTESGDLDEPGPSGGEKSGRHLRHSHFRTGHLRLLKPGHGRERPEYTFVRPAVIRPDLPAQATKTPYSVAPPKEGKVRDVLDPEPPP